MYVFWAGSVGACAIAFSEYSGSNRRAKTLNLRCECTIKDLISSPSAFRRSSCDFVDRPQPGVETRPTKSHEAARTKSAAEAFEKNAESNLEVMRAVPFVLDIAHD